jgi:hypothetical protein
MILPLPLLVKHFIHYSNTLYEVQIKNAQWNKFMHVIKYGIKVYDTYLKHFWCAEYLMNYKEK